MNILHKDGSTNLPSSAYQWIAQNPVYFYINIYMFSSNLKFIDVENIKHTWSFSGPGVLITPKADFSRSRICELAISFAINDDS